MIDTEAYIAELQSSVHAVLHAHARALQTLARTRVRRNSGRLANSIRIQERDGKIVVGTDLDYGAFLEFGTSHMIARPWLMPAVEQIKPALRTALKNI